MRKSALWRWAVLAPLLTGCLFEVSCTRMWRDAVFQGTVTWLTGAVGTTFNTAELTNLFLGLSPRN
jgi:hypothetical protein